MSDIQKNENISLRQKKHYESIHDTYEEHYFDAASLLYREKFIYNWLFKGMDFNNLYVADLACGSGHNSVITKKRFPSVHITGYDISSKACIAYRENTKQRAYEFDLTQPEPVGFVQLYDVVIIIGGLHHCINDIDSTLNNIAMMLKPSGKLLMMEPNKRYFLESVRKLWYKHDKYFDAETEEALDHDELLKKAHGKFRVERVKYLGGPAYFLILNSLLFRIPTRLKPFIVPPLFFMERIYNSIIPTRRGFPIFLACWEKISDPDDKISCAA